MPSDETPVRLNDSDFWAKNWQRTSVRASSSFRVPALSTSQSLLYTDAQLSDLLSKLPFSRQIHPFSTLESLHPPSHSDTHPIFPHVRTSRSIERETLARELHNIDDSIDNIDKQHQKMTDVLKKQRNTAIEQRNKLMKINEALTKYIATNTN
tara:strand:- start:7703 stop:8161 length:459 start_codon:yes stop_codon:yes gene_type:complete